VACSGAIASTPPGDGGFVARADARAEEAATVEYEGGNGDGGLAEASAVPDGAVVCAARSGTFECGSAACARSSEVCYVNACMTVANFSTEYGGVLGSCGSCLACDCWSPQPSCRCSDDGEGGITVSCQGCYGAPPARLERVA
jgi:hypothetical protein